MSKWKNYLGAGMKFLDFLLICRLNFCFFVFVFGLCLSARFFQDGSAVSVRACAYFPGWELYVHSARLVVRISNDSEGTHFILLLGIHA